MMKPLPESSTKQEWNKKFSRRR